MFYFHLLFAIIFACFITTAAEPLSKPGIPVFGKRVLPSKYASAPVAPDGKLDESDWNGAGSIGDFEIRADGTRPFKTEIRALHNDRKIYLAAICGCDDGEQSIVANEPEGGQIYRDDSVEIFLMSKSGKRYQVCVNAIGHVLILDPDNMKSGAGDYLKCGAFWDEARRAYVLELEMDREKFDMLPGGLDSYGISFIRNMQVKAGGNRSYSFKWHDALPEKWGRLVPADPANLKRISSNFAGRLKTLISGDLQGEFLQEPRKLLTLLDKKSLTLDELSGVETELIRLESEANGKYWQNKFEMLFQKQ